MDFLLSDEEIQYQIQYLYDHNKSIPLESMVVALCKSIAKAQDAATRRGIANKIDFILEHYPRIRIPEELPKLVQQLRKVVNIDA